MNFEFKSVEEIQEQGSGNYGILGKNEGATLDEFDFTEGEYGPSITVTFKVGDGVYKRFINPVTKVFAKAGGEIDSNHPEYANNKKAAEDRIILFLNQVAEAVSSADTVRQALTSQQIPDMVTYFKVMERLVKSQSNWKEKPLDLFLQYQYTPRAGKTRTYLEIPKPDNLKNGNLIYVTAAQGPGYNEVKDNRGLRYINSEGKEHPIKRTTYWLSQPYSQLTNTEAPISSGSEQFNVPSGGSDLGDSSW